MADDTDDTDDADARRRQLKAFMAATGLKADPWAKKAGVASSTLYNFMRGASDSVGWSTLSRLARAAGCGIAHIIGEVPLGQSLPLRREAIRRAIIQSRQAWDLIGYRPSPEEEADRILEYHDRYLSLAPPEPSAKPPEDGKDSSS